MTHDYFMKLFSWLRRGSKPKPNFERHIRFKNKWGNALHCDEFHTATTAMAHFPAHLQDGDVIYVPFKSGKDACFVISECEWLRNPRDMYKFTMTPIGYAGAKNIPLYDTSRDPSLGRMFV